MSTPTYINNSLKELFAKITYSIPEIQWSTYFIKTIFAWPQLSNLCLNKIPLEKQEKKCSSGPILHLPERNTWKNTRYTLMRIRWV